MTNTQSSPPDPESSKAGLLERLAREHGVSTGAIDAVYSALQRSGGSMAQFDHKELGGHGQWMAGGMTMVGDMSNSGLKAKVAAICEALRPHVADSTARSGPAGSTASDREERETSGWWPTGLSSPPAATGGQNDFRYAYFPRDNALVVERGGESAVYDTTGHDFLGFGQQQPGAAGFTLQSAQGDIELSSLRRKKVS